MAKPKVPMACKDPEQEYLCENCGLVFLNKERMENPDGLCPHCKSGDNFPYMMFQCTRCKSSLNLSKLIPGVSDEFRAAPAKDGFYYFEGNCPNCFRDHLSTTDELEMKRSRFKRLKVKQTSARARTKLLPSVDYTTPGSHSW